MELTFEASLHRILERLGIVLKQGRDHISSPDPQYAQKLESIVEHLEAVRASDGHERLLFLDELTYYRQPTAVRAYEARGAAQPLAERSHRSNTPTRVIGTVDALDGCVVFWQGASTSIDRIVAFYRLLRAQYVGPERLYVVLDNWPVHYHPDVLVALEPQATPFPFPRPRHWSPDPSARALKKWGDLQLPIQLLPLPTYASWTNPIEKLWKLGRQTVLHLHRFATDLDLLRTRFAGFLTAFADGSADLLRYIGLEHLDRLYRSARDRPDETRPPTNPPLPTLFPCSPLPRAPT